MKTNYENLNGIGTVWSSAENLLEDNGKMYSARHLSVLFWGERMELYIWIRIFDWLFF